LRHLRTIRRYRSELLQRQRPFRLRALLAVAISLLGQHFSDAAVLAQSQTHTATRVKHVLLLSLDGMHAIDLARYINEHPTSALAELSSHGVTYTDAQTSLPSNSWPGLLAIVTGGSPISTGVIFENSYDRSLSPPGSNCTTVGTPIIFDSHIDVNPDAADAGGGIDPKKLPLDPAKSCTPVFPHAFVRVNNIFEVVKRAGGRTAWADKHPAYDFLNGPSGDGVDDLFTPEIRPVTKARSVAKTEGYDDTKVQAILNEIGGRDHAGTRRVGVPTLFGMNFQSISMAQKMSGNGYKDGNATPTAGLNDAFTHTDQSIARMIAALKREQLWESTVIIVSAKHGDVPIDPAKFRLADLKLIPQLISAIDPKLLLNAEQDGSIAMLWLRQHERTEEVVNALLAKQKEADIQQIFWGESLKLLFDDPFEDPRMPDIVIQPNFGTIYADLDAGFIEEHGGFTEEDTHVPLLVALPSFAKVEVKSPVRTAQIAPTVLQLLGLDPKALQAVKKEMTQPLPVP
jgi:predicted AlkP superfamily pyrophosphatase or phosphodiesterase